MKFPFENLGVHRDSNSQSGSSLGSVRVHSLTLSYTLGSMKCDSRASLFARTFTSPCLGCEPKVKVATFYVLLILLLVNYLQGYNDIESTNNVKVMNVDMLLWTMDHPPPTKMYVISSLHDGAFKDVVH
jgi:hypothetical protein